MIAALVLALTTPAAARAGDDAATTMAAFVTAVRARDRPQLAGFFPTTGKLVVVNTLEKPFERAAIAADRLARQLRPGGDLDDLLFGDDGFRDYVTRDHRQRWRPRGTTFVPPYATGPPVWLKWRREGERWVIDEIALPSS